MRWRWALPAAVLIAAAGVAAFVWSERQFRASLPLLEGRHALPGLSAPVTVARDALGIPSIRGASREDVARATGFLHAQDRFFQMDLSRRRAAGELAALVGVRALPLDSEIRVHRFRAVAERALVLAPPFDRAVLEAYADGVNRGLAELDAVPFEYLLLGEDPAPWRPEDSLLVVLAMFITLQDTGGEYEATLGTMRDVLPPAVFEFLTPAGTEWDAPVIGPAFSVPAVPGPDVYDLRARRAGKPPIQVPPPPFDRVAAPAAGAPGLAARVVEEERRAQHARRTGAIGSNNWAVSGALTGERGALLANDMHLSVRVPNIWYRALLEWTDPAAPADPHRAIGVTLPGFPAVVAGSNTHVAWGFTNTYADWSDIVLLELDPADPTRYRTPHGLRRFERHEETIEVAGEEARRETVLSTIWGPVIGPDHRGRLRAYRWVAHSAERLATAGLALELARSIEEAFQAANGIGAPGQNMLVADRSGRIGWSIYGAIPQRVGVDGELPTSWADGSRGWAGWLDPARYPRIVDPGSGRLWTANARVVDGEMLDLLGDGSYEVGSRATIIRDRLLVQDRFTVEDMLDIQLETSARFLDRWRDLILETLTPAATARRPDRAQFRAVVERDWTGDASPGSASYRLTRTFREQVSERVMAFVLAECYEADAEFDHRTLRRREGPIWKLITERPLHLLDAQYASWDELLVDAVDAVIARAPEEDLGQLVWSRYNVTAYRHPLSAALPFVGRWLDMPLVPLPGDLFTPRVHWGTIGASQRMVVSPGREADGIMQMPTGQSGHPLSPFYANSHAAWLNGEKSPFLPGAEAYRLELLPSATE